jgi:hypothetical protein
MSDSTFLISIAALSLVISTASAGTVQPAPVMIDLDNMQAQGDMATARFSDNEFEFIGCGVRQFDDGSGGDFTFGFCQARVADDAGIVCVTLRSSLIDAMKSIGDYSFITFGWDENGDCTRVGISTQSFYIPEFKLKDK